jgi:hypothetical protein
MINESDKYTGMREMNFGLNRNVYITGAAGAFLGLLLAMWVTSDVGIIAAAVVVFAVLSGIFGMFV